MKPKIGIMLPVHNDIDFIEDCIKSILNSTYSNYKVYITDDGSDDGTEKILQNYADRLTQYIDLHRFKKNKGVGYAMNNAGKRAVEDGCKYVFIMSGDDKMIANGLEFAYKTHKQTKGAIFTTCAIRYIGGAVGTGIPGGNQTYETNLERNGICGFSLIDAKVWKEEGGYDEKLFNPPFKCSMEDYELFTRLLKRRENYAMCREPVVEYRIHAKQTIKKQGEYRPIALEAMAKKHPLLKKYNPHFKKG